jgi:hypothetical protein
VLVCERECAVCVCRCVCVRARARTREGMRADGVGALLCVDIIGGYCCVLISVDGHKFLFQKN